MSALRPSDPQISIGGGLLSRIGLMPQRISFASEARFPGHAVAAGMQYQKTGIGAQTLTIEAQTYPHVTGGLDAYAILKAIHLSQSIVPYIRLRGNYLGEANGFCGIETLEADEEKLHPHDGVGRIIDVTLGLILFPKTAIFTQNLSVISLRGLIG